MAPAPLQCSVCALSPACICHSCVRKRLAQHKTAQSTLVASVGRHEARAQELLDGRGGLTEVRQVEAEIGGCDRRLLDFRREQGRLQAEILHKRQRIDEVRASLSQRRSTLSSLSASPPAVASRSLLTLATSSPNPYTLSLRSIRHLLLSELLDMFDVRVFVESEDDEDGIFKSPEMDRREEGRGEWLIDGLVLPLPGDVTLSPPNETNAALVLTLHLLSLFSTYLSLPLPFLPFLRPPSLLPSSAHPNLLSNLPDVQLIIAKHPHHILPLTVPQKSADTILVALAGLQYDVCYLAGKVGLEIPLNETGDVLFNLYRIVEQLGSTQGSASSTENLWSSPSQQRAQRGSSGRKEEGTVEPVSLERILLSLRGGLPFKTSSSRTTKDRDQRRLERESLKASETPAEREERRRRRRERRKEKEERDRARGNDEWEVVGGSLESIRKG